MLIKSITNALAILFCLISLISSNAVAAAAVSPVTVSVLPFSEDKSSSTPWLGNAIADLIMQNFAEIPSIHVVDHEHLTQYLSELELQQTAFVDQATALQIGRISKASHVVSGRLQKDNRDNLHISMLVLETASQSVQQHIEVDGNIKDINELCRQLTLKFISKNTTPPDEAVLQR
ncbi:MAG: hypothetical protein D3910_20670, partial [Candidatus Electrothrix sp. ATG2]|nr:hypothetical protein [Candidatus Electrothrix sp. ATG2]